MAFAFGEEWGIEFLTSNKLHAILLVSKFGSEIIMVIVMKNFEKHNT